MALSNKAKVALGLGSAAVVGVGVALWSSNESKKKPKAVCPPGQVNLGTDSSGVTMCAPGGLGTAFTPGSADLDFTQIGFAPSVQPSAVEPPGGWLHRWDERKAEAIERCRARGALLSGWSDFVECVLKFTFPEATHIMVSPRPNWLKVDATKQVRDDIVAQLKANDISTQGWSFQLWLKFSVYIDDCYEALAPSVSAVAHCVASQIYPSETWPPHQTLSANHWKRKFWDSLVEATKVYEDLQTADPLSNINLSQQ